MNPRWALSEAAAVVVASLHPSPDDGGPCATCAFREGTEAEKSDHTVALAALCVEGFREFQCHEMPRLCRGFIAALNLWGVPQTEDEKHAVEAAGIAADFLSGAIDRAVAFQGKAGCGMIAEPLCSEIECGQQRDHPNHNSGNPDGHFFHVGKPLLDPNVKREPPPVDEVTDARRIRNDRPAAAAGKTPAAAGAVARPADVQETAQTIPRTIPRPERDGTDDLVVALKLSVVKAAADKSYASLLVGAFLLTATAPMTTSELSKALSAQEGRRVPPQSLNGGLRRLMKRGLVLCVPRILGRRGSAVTDVNAWYPSDSLAAWVSRQGVTG